MSRMTGYTSTSWHLQPRQDLQQVVATPEHKSISVHYNHSPMFLARRSIVIATLAATALAQSSALDKLSDKCKAAINKLSEDSNASSCLGISNLEAIAVLVQNNSDKSLIDPVNVWLTGVCDAPSCSDDTLKTVVDQLKSECDVELPTETPQLYPAFRSAFCLQISSKNCITRILTDIQKAVGTLDVPKLTSLLGFEDSTFGTVANTTSAYCTECAQKFSAAISSASLDENLQVNLNPFFSETCPASDIVIYNDGAMSITSSALKVSGVVVVLSLFALL